MIFDIGSVKKETIISVFLLIILFVTVQFFILKDWIEETEKEYKVIAEQSYDEGARDAIISLLMQTDDCTLSSITFENFTRYVIDVSCVNDSPWEKFQNEYVWNISILEKSEWLFYCAINNQVFLTLF